MSESRSSRTTVRIGAGQIEALRYLNSTRESSYQELTRYLLGEGVYVSKQQVIKGLDIFFKTQMIERKDDVVKISSAGKKLLELVELLILQQSRIS